jgi:hypothetical protein
MTSGRRLTGAVGARRLRLPWRHQGRRTIQPLAAGEVTTPRDDFVGNDVGAGELDRRALANMVRLIALRGEHIGVTIGPIAIEHRGERMAATFTVTLSSGSHLFPDQLGVYQIESAWRNENGKWRCYSELEACDLGRKKTPRKPEAFLFCTQRG